MSYYPPIDVAVVRNLNIVKKLAAEQPDYFENSPYPKEIEDFLNSKVVVKNDGRKVEVESGKLDVLNEIQTTYTELKNHIPAKEDSAATMSYFRTRASLLDKLLEQMERGRNQKQISEFYQKVLEILEEVCSPTQRNIFQEQLRDFAND